jgi:hypothetical protein
MGGVEGLRLENSNIVVLRVSFLTNLQARAALVLQEQQRQRRRRRRQHAD